MAQIMTITEATRLVLRTSWVIVRKKWHVKATPLMLEEYLRNEMIKDNKQQKSDNLDDLINTFIMARSRDSKYQTKGTENNQQQ